jgi:hypothetical protein
MDLSGPGIDVKLKERKKEHNCNALNIDSFAESPPKLLWHFISHTCSNAPLKCVW